MPTEEMVMGLGDDNYAYYISLIENGCSPREAWESVENVMLLEGPFEDDPERFQPREEFLHPLLSTIF